MLMALTVTIPLGAFAKDATAASGREHQGSAVHEDDCTYRGEGLASGVGVTGGRLGSTAVCWLTSR